MNRSESKYFQTAAKMDEALLSLLEKKDLAYITVKEICAAAGVNRSTFYLHYETIGDLLDEAVEYIQRDFESRFPAHRFPAADLSAAPAEQLMLLGDEYLAPYLEFVRRRQNLYLAAIDRPHILDAQNTYSHLFRTVFDPILDRFGIPAEDRGFYMDFYLSGVAALVKRWLASGCKKSVEEMTRLIRACALAGRDAP